jgi:Beta-ketoacyl synthase, N-terminal domain
VKVAIHSVALIGPGLDDWAGAQATLRGELAAEPRPSVVPAAARLPAAERRRVGLSVKVAIALAEQLFANSELQPSQAASIFTSSGGDGENCHLLCEALDQAVPSLSPTRFTNSVHNAPAGYWGIAAQARLPSSTLCGYDASFVAGLMEAAVYAQYEREPVALVAYDVPYPEPLNSKRTIMAAGGIALLLAAPGTLPQPLAIIELAGYTRLATRALADPHLEAIRSGIPACRGLPLLIALARRQSMQLSLAGNGEQVLPVSITIDP